MVTTKRTKAHACYKKHLSDINAHGLILLHGPVNYSAVQSELGGVDFMLQNSIWPFYFHRQRTYFNEQSNFLGTLLLGDITLKGPLAINFPAYFTDRFKDIHIYQVPHHGSDKNWDGTFKGHINQGNRPLAVCNFGYGNTFGHPGSIVMKDLKDQIMLNTQFFRLDYYYTIQY